MKRRQAIGGLASLAIGVVAAGALAAPAMVGYISSGSESSSSNSLAGFRAGMRDSGLSENRDFTLEFRWSDGHYDRLEAMTRELVDRGAAIIFCAGMPAALAAKTVTRSLPIVFVAGADPVKLGLVASLARPGGNVTGVTQMYGELGAKRVELLRELVPGATLLAVISNPRNANAALHTRDIEAAARAVGWKAVTYGASTAAEIDSAFALVASRGSTALLVADDPFYNTRRSQMIERAARHAVPVMYYAGEFVDEGGLISYASSVGDNTRLAAQHVARILKGAKPAELPVLQPTKFELAVNLRTARILGLKVPQSIQLRVDRLIE